MLNVVRVAALAALLVLPFAVRAEQAAPAAEQAAMPCPHAGKDGCCGGACAEMQAKAASGASDQAAPGAEGGCPCQRAARAKAAEAAKQKAAQP